MFYVYVIKNSKGILYKGFTSDLEKRLKQHNDNSGFVSYTTSRGPWTLFYSEQYQTETQARNREKFFKSGKGREFLKTLQ